MKKILISSFVLIVALSGCTPPIKYSEKPMQSKDKDTEYSIEERKDGFEVTVCYSRYQFVPESAAISEACKQALTSTAYEIADKRNKKIKQINEQRIKLSFGRNGLTGITSCSATAPIEYK